MFAGSLSAPLGLVFENNDFILGAGFFFFFSIGFDISADEVQS
jgi:hypothetical protein